MLLMQFLLLALSISSDISRLIAGTLRRTLQPGACLRLPFAFLGGLPGIWLSLRQPQLHALAPLVALCGSLLALLLMQALAARRRLFDDTPPRWF